MLIKPPADIPSSEITPKGMTAQINLTITDDYPLAQAIVIITAVAEAPQSKENS